VASAAAAGGVRRALTPGAGAPPLARSLSSSGSSAEPEERTAQHGERELQWRAQQLALLSRPALWWGCWLIPLRAILLPFSFFLCSLGKELLLQC
jgi:hypothetical protein